MSYLRALRQRNRPRKFAVPSLAESIPRLVTLSGSLRLPGYCEDVVMNVDIHILLLQAGKIECRGDRVFFVVVMDIQPT